MLAVATALVAPGAAEAAQYGDWQPAAPVVAVNAASNEGCPIESPDGLSLFIMSTRAGTQDIWVATRPARDAAWSEPTRLDEPVNSPANDFCPTPLRGGGLLFVSDRGGADAYGTAACGMGDIYWTRLSPATGAWSPPRNLGCAPAGPNTAGMEYGPSLVESEAGTQLYFSSGGALPAGPQDIYVSAVSADGTVGAGALVPELNAEGANDFMPNVRKDGREVVFASTRPGGFGASDIWVSERASALDPWGPVRNLGPHVNTALGESRPSLSWKADRLYFGRPPAPGAPSDIYVSTR